MLVTLLLLQVTLPAPTASRPPVALAEERLAETSGLAASPSRPGVLWTLNDSGNPAELFAIDTAGRALGRVLIEGVANRDWEALAFGPCRPPSAARTTPPCLYVGDIGDNERVHPTIVIYQLAEPDPAGEGVVQAFDSLHISYADGPRDAESMAIDALGNIWIVTKELVREPRIYRVPARAWSVPGTATATFVASLPIPSPSGIEHWTTDASWMAGRGALAVRTYGGLWKVPFADGAPLASATRPLCTLAGMGPQGEGLAWLGGDLFALTSEKLFSSKASIALVRCGT
jgi:hypothetical protein